jgi:hypothetical protein
MTHGILESSCGYVEFDIETGEVLGGELTDYLRDIERVDVDEWVETYPNESLEGPHDILDFGLWLKGGAYDEPDYDWRNDRKRAKHE